MSHLGGVGPNVYLTDSGAEEIDRLRQRIAELEATVRKWHTAWHDVAERLLTERELLRKARTYAARALPPRHGNKTEFQRDKSLLLDRIDAALSERPQP